MQTVSPDSRASHLPRFLLVLALCVAGAVGGSRPAAAVDAFSHCSDSLPYGVPKAIGPVRGDPVCHAGYAALYDVDRHVPRWVAYQLTAAHAIGCLPRAGSFSIDRQVARADSGDQTDYLHSGYDIGHMAPAEDFAWDKGELHDSFSFANAAPQLPGLNRQGWERLEEMVRAWAWMRGQVLVYVGPVVRASDKVIGGDHVDVPAVFWKVIVDPARKQAIAFMVPQRALTKSQMGAAFESSVKDVESAAGLDLPLPAGINVSAKPALWAIDLSGYRRRHKDACR